VLTGRPSLDTIRITGTQRELKLSDSRSTKLPVVWQVDLLISSKVDTRRKYPDPFPHWSVGSSALMNGDLGAQISSARENLLSKTRQSVAEAASHNDAAAQRLRRAATHLNASAHPSAPGVPPLHELAHPREAAESLKYAQAVGLAVHRQHRRLQTCEYSTRRTSRLRGAAVDRSANRFSRRCSARNATTRCRRSDKTRGALINAFIIPSALSSLR
jgi:hypothetical protein